MNYPGKAAYFIVNSLLLLAFGVLSFGSQAKVVCEGPWDEATLTGYEELTYSLATGVMLTSARDLPVGSIIYRQSFRVPAASRKTGLKGCQTNISGENAVVHIFEGFEETIPGTPTGQNLNDNPVYSTGVEGIGYVVLWNLRNANPGFTVNSPLIPQGERAKYDRSLVASLVTDEQMENGTGGSSGTGLPLLSAGYITFLLVKTGNIPEGIWDIPVSLPPIVANMTTYQSEIGIDTFQKSQRFSFIPGTIKVMATTCQTPDVKVQLGSHRISDVIEAGDVTDWVDFDIKLLNCPPMLGRYGFEKQNGFTYTPESPDTAAILGEPDGSLTVDAANLSNAVQFSITPVNGSVLGCASLNPEEDSAKGICVEIRTRDENKQTINAGWIGSGLILQNSTSDYSIPLKARYKRMSGVSGTMKPGIANADVTFTINYQ